MYATSNDGLGKFTDVHLCTCVTGRVTVVVHVASYSGINTQREL